jgi:homospermidine synthase
MNKKLTESDTFTLNKINKLKFNKKILFLGFGSVAKCVLSYLQYYVDYDSSKVYIVDKCSTALHGLDCNKILKKNIIIGLDVSSTNFGYLLQQFGITTGDLIIDLTFFSHTYFFVNTCLLEGINYVNTSIEDYNDAFNGTSVDLQQKKIKELYDNCKKHTKIRSTVIIELGQNPGLYQHYVLYALNEMNKLYYNTNSDDYRKKTLTKVIDNYHIGTIFCSEIDNIVRRKEQKLKKGKIYNSWCVSGMLEESFDNVELAQGLKNTFIKPSIPEKFIDCNKTSMLPKNKNQGYEVIFLKSNAINVTLPSICPIIKDNKINFVNYRGKVIQHGETFELANYFGEKAPFLSYVYKMNKYALESLSDYFNNHRGDINDLKIRVAVESDCDSYEVFNNINKQKEDSMIGHDSVGCTIYCGKEKVDKIFWCGSILSDTDPNVHPNFTPTIIQVAAGALTGISYIIENKNKGLVTPVDLDTRYVFEKSSPLLGKLFFTEISKDKFKGNFKFQLTKI